MAPRHSPAVYRRRRLVVLGALLIVLAAVIFGIWAAIAQPWAAPSPTPTPAASDTATPSPQPTDGGAGTETPSPQPSGEESAGAVPCTAQDVEVVAVTDADSYQPGVLPQLSISLTNRSAGDCTIDVGSSTQVFTVTSGADVWWRSTDCQQNPSSMVVTLVAGQTVTSATPVPWDRTRSSVDTCDQDTRPRAPGGGASYHVSVSIGGFESAQSKQIILY